LGWFFYFFSFQPELEKIKKANPERPEGAELIKIVMR